MVGYDTHMGNSLVPAVDLIKALLNRSPMEQALAGELLLVIGHARLGTNYDAKAAKRDGLWGQAAAALARVAHGQIAAVPAVLRVRAGRALGLLEYGSSAELVHGAFPPLADPRLQLSLVRWPKVTVTETWKRMWQYYCCPIEDGSFWSGDERKEQLQCSEIRQPYAIARFPVTNAEYAQFMADGGYDRQQPWWTDNGRASIGKRRQPYCWDDSRYNQHTQPVVGVTWYEAAAYCGWLTRLGHTHGWLPEHDIIRLPTWYEWERAARHTDQRRHPWGDEAPTPERANYKETGIGAPSPVGCFPAGTAVCGAQDMLGNVLEWTASPWQQWDGWEKDFTNAEGVVLSWNSWAHKKAQMCCGARDRYIPDYRSIIQGFRVVQSLALG